MLGDHGQGYEISSVSIDLAAVPTEPDRLPVDRRPSWVHPQHSSVANTRLFEFENPSSLRRRA